MCPQVGVEVTTLEANWFDEEVREGVETTVFESGRERFLECRPSTSPPPLWWSLGCLGCLGWVFQATWEGQGLGKEGLDKPNGKSARGQDQRGQRGCTQ